jgi:DNA-binding XRE family transcriptional regulator
MRNNLINARKKHEYTQLETAEMVGITERHYQKLEAGTSDGSIKVWERLKAILHAKSIDWLLEQTVDIHNLSKK